MSIFQKRFSEIIWQTSDPDLQNRKYNFLIKYEGLSRKIPPPLDLDVESSWHLPKQLVNSLQA